MPSALSSLITDQNAPIDHESSRTRAHAMAFKMVYKGEQTQNVHVDLNTETWYSIIRLYKKMITQHFCGMFYTRPSTIILTLLRWRVYKESSGAPFPWCGIRFYPKWGLCRVHQDTIFAPILITRITVVDFCRVLHHYCRFFYFFLQKSLIRFI